MPLMYLELGRPEAAFRHSRGPHTVAPPGRSNATQPAQAAVVARGSTQHPYHETNCQQVGKATTFQQGLHYI